MPARLSPSSVPARGLAACAGAAGAAELPNSWYDPGRAQRACPRRAGTGGEARAGTDDGEGRAGTAGAARTCAADEARAGTTDEARAGTTGSQTVTRLYVLAALVALGCAAARRFRPLSPTRNTPARASAQEASQRALEAHARARALLERAEAANRQGDSASAQILAEHAIAAFEHAVVLSRRARAEAGRGDAEARHAAAERELFELDQQQRRELAEVEALELRARASCATPHPCRATHPRRPRASERDSTRPSLVTAGALVMSVSAAPRRQPSSLAPLVLELDALDAKLTKNALPAPIDDATRLRSRCLSELGQVRRPRTAATPAGGGDALLAALSATWARPPATTGAWSSLCATRSAPTTDWTSKGGDQLRVLAEVAKAHPEFPILVVLHTAKGAGGDREKKRLDLAITALRTAGAPKVDGVIGGDNTPIVEPGRPGAGDRNARLEVVFVAPTSS